MPSHANLKPIEVADFSPGLHTVADWLVPAQGWQAMEDCYPQVGGGLRAFHKASSIVTTGLANITGERCVGMHARGGILGSSGVGMDRYLATWDHRATPVSRPWIYRMDVSDGDTIWTAVPTGSGPLAANTDSAAQTPQYKTSFRTYELANGDNHMLAVVRYDGDDTGLWYIDADSSTGACRLHTLNDGDFGVLNGAIGIHQARIFIGGGNGRIVWCEPGIETFDADQFLNLDPNRDGTRIVALDGVEPSDLLVLREGAPMVVVQGDINTSPSVQVGYEGIAPGPGVTDFCPTPNGLAFISNDGYMYLSDGRTATNISAQLSRFAPSTDYPGYGDIVYADEFIFAPGGRMYHFPTKSWFTQTQLAGQCKSVERYTNQVWGTVGSGVNFTLAKLTPQPGANADRVSTFNALSAPMHSDDGRQMVIRQVDAIVRTYDDNATVAITVNGTTNTQTIPTAGKQTVQFLFNERGEVLDVGLVSTAASSANEAPSIEALRYWTRSGNNTT